MPKNETKNLTCKKCKSNMVKSVDRSSEFEILKCPNCSDFIPICSRCNSLMSVERLGISETWRCPCGGVYSPIFSNIKISIGAEVFA